MEQQKGREPGLKTILQVTSLLVSWEDVPHWQQDNHYITSNYRRPSGSYHGSFASLFQIHNETVNIYSHLVPALLSLPASVFLYFNLRARYAHADFIDATAVGSFVLSFAIALCMSATYHTVSNHSPRVNRLGNQLDYVGIVLLIAGSFVPSIFYGFWCEPTLIFRYLTMIFALGVACATVSVTPKFRTPAWRPLRATLFVSMGLSAVLPVVHGLRLYGIAQMDRQIGLLWLSVQGLTYILGALIYASRIPERWFPGNHDIWGSSHQLFHILVVIAAACHLVGVLKAFDYRHGTKNGLCS